MCTLELELIGERERERNTSSRRRWIRGKRDGGRERGRERHRSDVENLFLKKSFETEKERNENFNNRDEE